MQRNIHVCFIICLVVLSAVSARLSIAETVDGVPIPPKRPDVMNVSPAYIEYLKNKTHAIKYNTKPDNENSIHNAPLKKTEINIDSQTVLQEIDTKNILSVISKDLRIESKPPIPSKKPISRSQQKYPHDVNTKEEQESRETTLVSFALEPSKIEINNDIENFLKDHALDLFAQDKNLTLQIHAYATPTDESEYSDVRLSLARALEVRNFLIKNNIEPSRLKLSPMGKDQQNNSDDRIDLVFVKQ